MGRRSRIVLLSSPEKTFLFGKHLANFLKPDSILALTGELGAGKTSFVQGLAAGLGISARVQSPTFTYLSLYEEGRLPLYHFDLYRMREPSDFFSMGFDEYFEKRGVTAIEWPQRLSNALPSSAISLSFSYSGEGRAVRIDPQLVEFLKSWD